MGELGLALLLTVLLAASPRAGTRTQSRSLRGRAARAVLLSGPTGAEAVGPEGRCSYTFVVPPSAPPGPVCVREGDASAASSAPPSSAAGNCSGGGGCAWRSELVALHEELRRHGRHITALQQLVEMDGGLVGEVKLLRKESHNMNARVTALYAQLLHEMIRRRDGALDAAQMEARILNQTADSLRLLHGYDELQRRFAVLSAVVTNQTATISRLEEQCRPGGRTPPSLAGGGPPNPPCHQPHPGGALPPLQPEPPAFDFGKHSAIKLSTNEIVGGGEGGASRRAAERVPRVPPVLPPAPPRQPPTPGDTKRSAASAATAVTVAPAGTGSTTAKPSGPWRDCLHALDEGQLASGVYLLRAAGRLAQAWCDQQQDPGGWTVIQRRRDGSVNFFRNWDAYKQGFGNINGEYWLGLEAVHALTSAGDYKLLVVLEDWHGRRVFAEYGSVRVAAEADGYRLRLGHFRGTAGDSLGWHNGRQFTTLDRDRDNYSGNCAHFQKGGWWYNACSHSNLNGVWYRGGHYRSKYQDGMYWSEFHGTSYSLRRVTMMVRPNPSMFH